MEEAYGEARKFVNLHRELELGKEGKLVVEAILEKEKRIIILDKVVQDKEVFNKNNRFALNHKGGGQWSINFRPWDKTLSPFRGLPLRISLVESIMRM